MDSKESEFFEKLMVIFREEAGEHLKAISDGLLELEKKLPQETHQQVIETIFREAHSLKGSARSVNHKSILEICQCLETVLSLWKQKKIEISIKSFDLLHTTLNIISQALSDSVDPSLISKTIEQIKSLSNQETDSVKLPVDLPKNGIKELETTNSESPTSSTHRQISQGKTIRVSLDKINHFFQEAEETLMIKVLFKAQLNHLKELQSNLFMQEKNLERLLTTVQNLRQNFQQDQVKEKNSILTENIFKLSEKQIHVAKSTRENLTNLLKNAEQNAHIVATTVDKLLDDLKKILMQPMSMLFETLPHMIRDLARELSKEIQVQFHGEDIEVDRRVLEGIKDPIIHLIRNAIDHGIESPQERTHSNKPSIGTIRITATESEGNNVKLSIADDGQGIDLDKIKQVSLKKGFVSEMELETMSKEDVIKLAFRSDVSTSPIVTELSGRGLGLGIVSENVDKLGGQVEITTHKGRGTTFTLILPLTLATFRGVYVSVGGQQFILPTHNVERVVRVKLENIKRAENRETIVLEGRSFSFVRLEDLLEISKSNSLTKRKDFTFALIVKGAEQTIAFGVDEVYREEEILVKGLGKQHIRIKNMMAATVTETGGVIPILNPVDLVKSSINVEVKYTSTDESNGVQATKKSILVVEDTITTRLLIKNILTSAGYEVKTAVDGVEALEILQNQAFDLVVTDIEMPRMDGFTLLEKIKTMPQLKEMPIVICTALGSSKDRQRGIELGANAYLDKSVFKFQSFVEIVQKLI